MVQQLIGILRAHNKMAICFVTCVARSCGVPHTVRLLPHSLAPRILSILLCALVLLLNGQFASAEIMFEGYYIIRLSGQSVGYTVQRYEFDAKTKQFTSTYFLKTNKQGGDITESLKAKCNDKFNPISYQYTSQTGDQIKTIDATIDKDILRATIFDGKNKSSVNKKFTQPGTFLSTFLGYLMLQNGYATGKSFSYSAVAEEEAEAYSGEATIKSEESLLGQSVYRIDNKFKGAEFTSYVNAKGEILGTSSPMQSISTELMRTAEAATQGHIVPTKTLVTLFGSVPKGNINKLVQSPGAAPSASTQKPSTTAPTPTMAVPTTPAPAAPTNNPPANLPAVKIKDSTGKTGP